VIPAPRASSREARNPLTPDFSPGEREESNNPGLQPGESKSKERALARNVLKKLEIKKQNLIT
jgi:hypothetical protein